MELGNLTRNLVLFFSAAAAASANSVIFVQGVDWGRGGSLWIREDYTHDVNAYFAGVMNIVVSENGQQFNRDTLCVDLFTNISINRSYSTEVLRPNQAPGKNLARVSWLVDNALLPTEGSYSSLLPESYWVRNALQGTAIQLAIWDIVHDAGDGLSAGRVQKVPGQTNAAVVQWVDTYLTVSAGMSSNLAYVYNNVDMGNGQPAQMLAGPMFLDGGPAPTPNPEPSTIAAGVGLAALLLVRCRSACRRKP